MVQDKEERRITVRVSPALYNQINSASKERNLTLNAFIIQWLERAVDPSSVESRLAAIEEKVKYLTDGP